MQYKTISDLNMVSSWLNATGIAIVQTLKIPPYEGGLLADQYSLSVNLLKVIKRPCISCRLSLSSNSVNNYLRVTQE